MCFLCVLQAAYYLQNGQTAASYESCSTSAFKHGRTETIRPATLETKAFSEAIAQSQLPSNAELKKLIMKCSEVHGNLTKEAAMGKDILFDALMGLSFHFFLSFCLYVCTLYLPVQLFIYLYPGLGEYYWVLMLEVIL